VNLPTWPDGVDCPTRVEIPAWTPLGSEYVADPSGVMVMTSALGDVDRDGLVDEVGLFRCTLSDRVVTQVVAFAETSRSQPELLGLVVASGTAGIDTIEGMGTRPDGSIQARVLSEEGTPHQVRTYAWSGQGFSQTAGPTEFLLRPNVIELGITGTARRNGGAVQVDIVVTSVGPDPVVNLVLVVAGPPTLAPAGEGWTRCTRSAEAEAALNATYVLCPLDTLGVEVTLLRTFTFTEVTPTASTAASAVSFEGVHASLTVFADDTSVNYVDGQEEAAITLPE
jgi:hypothetical protein